MSVYHTITSKKTPQNEAILGEDQVKNNAGGFVYKIDEFKQLERFLILGSEGGTYYVGEVPLTKENATNVIKAIATDGRRAVDLISDISVKGRAPKNDPAVFALALAASAKDVETRRYALSKLPTVCRIPTHIFQFVRFIKQFRGFGRAVKRAVADWYQNQPVSDLAYQMVKYQSRDGWSNADVLRQSHPKTSDPARNGVYRWVVDGIEEVKKRELPVPSIIVGFEEAKAAKTVGDAVRLVQDFNLSREMLPTEALTHPEVWEALLPKMPLTAMIRNLGNMSKVGLLKPLSSASRLVVEKLSDGEQLRKARVHPVALLIAMKTYQSGHGLRGKGEWTPVPAVIAALDDAFYKSFDQITPTGKRFLFGVDVSGSMSSPMGTLPISCAEGAAVMAMACARSEKEHYIMGFTSSGRRYGSGPSPDLAGFIDLGITPRMSLNEALTRTRYANFGSTDCALPMLWADKNQVEVDCFVVITDNETWAGTVHPSQALRFYRANSGIQAREVVIGMTATKFSIADPNDPLTLDVVGFDTSVPEVISSFARG